jgi:Arc/MetJ family transcription regulator
MLAAAGKDRRFMILIARHPEIDHHMAKAAATRAMHVYCWCMAKVRTNIEIEDEYVEVIKARYHLRTKTEAVDLALRKLAGEPMSKAEALAMRGSKAIGKIPADRGPRGGNR